MAQRHMDYPDIVRYDTFPKLLEHNARQWPGDVAMREKEYGIWNEYTWAQCARQVRLMALGLRTLGLGRDDVVGAIGDNRPQWVWAEVAAHAIGGMSLGIYQDSMNDEVAYLINYAEAKAVICEDEEQADKLLAICEECPTLQHIIYADPRGMRKYEDHRLMSLADLCARGEAVDRDDPAAYEQMINAIDGSAVAILCSTSGTTSRPKLSMLAGGPFLDHCCAYLRADTRCPGDNYVSVLPLPWIMEQVYGVGQWLIARAIVNFVEEPETMMSDLREIGPHFVLLAPRVWESIAADVRSRMMDSTRFKRFMFDLGMKWGMQALEQGTRSRLADWILFRALRDRLGFTYLHSAATGGAALGPETFKFFQAMGVPLRQIYGQTELAGAYVVHREGDVDFDTVGLPFDNAQLRIDDPDHNGVGEIVARSSGMFVGYFKNEEATRADVRDGWMYTGDAGYIKENGHLVVIDRVKDIATTSTGTRFSPQFIENKLKFSPFIAEAVILGQQRPYLSAIICIRFGILSKWAEQRSISFTNYTNLAAHPDVYALLEDEIRKVNATLPEAQRVRRFLLLYKELDPDDGELTRTRKVRRGVIGEKYADIIDCLYGEVDHVDVDTFITFQDGTKSRIQTQLRIVDLAPGDDTPRDRAPAALRRAS